jgi:hypothetical protein
MTRTETRGSRATWTAGLAVAIGAGVATAHGLYQVAAASGVPHPVAWLYPLITDGLALVAYAATARLHSTGRRYAAVVVVGAAGLSGLAQAVYLAGGITTRATAPVGLRFGVGFWPAAAAAIAAHLLHLIGSGDDPTEAAEAGVGGVENRPANHSAPDTGTEPGAESNVAASNRPSNPSNGPVFNPASNSPVQPRPTEPRTTEPRTTPPVQPEPEPQLYNPAPALNAEQRATGRQSAAERARAAAANHRDRTGALPTVTELTRLADVARGTAGSALKALRNERPPLHLVNQPPTKGTHP